MAQLLRIFVSATTDLESYRGVIGRTLAELPVRIGAEIRRCAPEGTSYETLFELIGNVDRVYFLMGSDITAPAGAEWDLALHLQRSLCPIRHPMPLTPSGRHFLQRARNQIAPREWLPFQTTGELTRIIALDLIDILLHPRNRYGITLTEIDQLTTRRRLLQAQIPDHAYMGNGAEGGGIILDGRPVSR